MSNSIWHKAGFHEAIDNKLKSSKDGKWIYWTMYGWNIAGEDVHDIGVEWAYLEDIIAQADKAERLQKAVDLAVGALKRIDETYEEEYYKGDDEHDACDWLNCADDMDDLATDTIDEIKQLIKGE